MEKISNLKKVLLTRLDLSDQGTFGVIIVDDLTLYTGELPWIDNESNISCIPKGIYQCKWTHSNRFKKYMYEVCGVEKRSGIRKHSANLMGNITKGFKAQLNGCIALGERLGWMNGQKALLLSAPAMRRFESYLHYQPFELEIR